MTKAEKAAKVAKDAAAAKAARPTRVMVMNDQARVVFFGGRKLIPGVNVVPAEVADAMKENGTIKKMPSLTIADAPPATKGLDIPEAEELVGKTNDDNLLHEYQSEDARPEVAKAIFDKREKLKPSEKSSDKDA